MSTTSLKKELLVFFNTKYEDYSNQVHVCQAVIVHVLVWMYMYIHACVYYSKGRIMPSY